MFLHRKLTIKYWMFWKATRSFQSRVDLTECNNTLVIQTPTLRNVFFHPLQWGNDRKIHYLDSCSLAYLSILFVNSNRQAHRTTLRIFPNTWALYKSFLVASWDEDGHQLGKSSFRRWLVSLCGGGPQTKLHCINRAEHPSILGTDCSTTSS